MLPGSLCSAVGFARLGKVPGHLSLPMPGEGFAGAVSTLISQGDRQGRVPKRPRFPQHSTVSGQPTNRLPLEDEIVDRSFFGLRVLMT